MLSPSVECPTGSGRRLTLWQISREIAVRLTRIFLRDDQGRWPVYGGLTKFQNDPQWRDYILFHEYFHGDNGASHQTGWTGLIARLLQFYGSIDDFETDFWLALTYSKGNWLRFCDGMKKLTIHH